jgi:hypothetical protein
MRSGWLWGQVLEELRQVINTHLSDSLAIAGSDVHTSFLGLLLTSDEDVVPLIELSISDFLVKLGV